MGVKINHLAIIADSEPRYPACSTTYKGAGGGWQADGGKTKAVSTRQQSLFCQSRSIHLAQVSERSYVFIHNLKSETRTKNVVIFNSLHKQEQQAPTDIQVRFE